MFLNRKSPENDRKKLFFTLPMNTSIAYAHCPEQAPTHQAATSVARDLLSLLLPQFQATGTGPVQDASATDKIRFCPNTKPSLLIASGYKTQTRCPKMDQIPLSAPPESKAR
jgi:hypothetical protein